MPCIFRLFKPLINNNLQNRNDSPQLFGFQSFRKSHKIRDFCPSLPQDKDIPKNFSHEPTRVYSFPATADYTSLIHIRNATCISYTKSHSSADNPQNPYISQNAVNNPHRLYNTCDSLQPILYKVINSAF